MKALVRHQLLWPKPHAWPDLLAQCVDSAKKWQRAALPMAQLALWQEQDWPLVVCRQAIQTLGLIAEAMPPAIALGLPLPPSASGEKIRLALQLSPLAVARQSDAMTLEQMLTLLQPLPQPTTAPMVNPKTVGWASCPPLPMRNVNTVFGREIDPSQIARTAMDNMLSAHSKSNSSFRDSLSIAAGIDHAQFSHLQALQQELAALALEVRVFGSWSWQALTALPYLRPNSDIDLLLLPHNAAQLDAGLAVLQRYAQLLPLDGEIVFPGELAVAWREWLTAPESAGVLVKSATHVSLHSRHSLLARFAQPVLDSTYA